MTGLNSVVKLFEEENFVKACAPMVRYSKLEFRSLVRKYDCDLCFTPMIMADSFVKSDKARDIHFNSNEGDRPLIVQFAANNVEEMVKAAEMVAPFCDGVDLNCGCPQRWAMKEGYGSAMLHNPELVQDIVKQLRNRIPKPFSISVKIRILKEFRKTIELCQAIEASGATFLTVHGRTPSQRTEPIDIAAMKEIRRNVSLPLIANGDVKTLQDAKRLQELTGYNGVMSARGILQNPALFAGFDRTPLECVEEFLRICLPSDTYFPTFHHHLVFMVEKVMEKQSRRVFNSLRTKESVVKFLHGYFGISVPSDLVTTRTDSTVYEPSTIPTLFPFENKKNVYSIEDYLADSCDLYNKEL